jgi:hypothetical protein
MREYSASKLWFWWVVATTVVGTVGLVVPDTLVLGLPAYEFVDDNAIYPFTLWFSGLLLVAAPSVGITQALVLRHFTGLLMLQEWTIATTLGVFSAMLVNILVNVTVLIGGGLLLPGTVIGFAQWLVLRRYAERAGWWVLVCTIGWNAGLISGWAVGANLLPAGWFVFPFYPTESAVYWVVPWFLGIVTFSAITGFALRSLPFQCDTKRSVPNRVDQQD